MAANVVPGSALAPSQWQLVQDLGKGLVPAQACGSADILPGWLKAFLLASLPQRLRQGRGA